MAKKKPAKTRLPKSAPKGRSTQQLDSMMSALESEWQLSRDRDPIQSPYELPPGLHLNIPFIDYCRIPGINQSSLGAMKLSPHHYRYAPPSEPAPHLQFGSLFHEGHLEPDLLAHKYVVVPEETFVQRTQAWRQQQGEPPYTNPKSTTHYKQQVADYLRIHPGKQQVSLSWFTDIAHMLKRLNENPLAVEIFADGIPELTMIWDDPETKLRCKGRMDFLSLSKPCMADLKTTADNVVEWHLDKWDYHLQSAFYFDGYASAWSALSKGDRKLFPSPLQLQRFYFIVCEKKAPYCCLAAHTAAADMLSGRDEYRYLLRLIRHCTDTQSWPCPPNPGHWTTSRWFRKLDFPSALHYAHYGVPRPHLPFDDSESRD